jgi:predicted ATPase
VLLAQLSVLAQELRDPDLLLQMHHAAGSTHCTDGRFTLALDEVDACIAGYDLARHRHQAMQYGGHDPCVCTTCIGALARFIKGQRRAAERWSDDALDLAGRVDHAPSVAHAQVYRAELGQIRGEVDSTLQLADSVLAIGIEKGLSQYAAWAKMMRGWALARQGRADAGLAEIEEGLQALRRTGVRYHTPHRLGMRAQAYIAAGRHAQARDAIDEAIASVAATGERWYEAELVRLDAAVLAGTAAPDERAVEARLEQAIALDLADRLARRSRPDAARDVLRPVLAWGEDVDLVERAAAAAFVARLS